MHYHAICLNHPFTCCVFSRITNLQRVAGGNQRIGNTYPPHTYNEYRPDPCSFSLPCCSVAPQPIEQLPKSLFMHLLPVGAAIVKEALLSSHGVCVTKGSESRDPCRGVGVARKIAGLRCEAIHFRDINPMPAPTAGTCFTDWLSCSRQKLTVTSLWHDTVF